MIARPDPFALSAIIRRGRPALAWEILRRNPEYQRAFARLTVHRIKDVAVEAAFLADWGLHVDFR